MSRLCLFSFFVLQFHDFDLGFVSDDGLEAPQRRRRDGGEDLAGRQMEGAAGGGLMRLSCVPHHRGPRARVCSRKTPRGR